jgi:phosphatidylserine decarboxylase
VFAPRSGPYLFAGAAAIVGLAALLAADVVPRAALLLGFLIVLAGLWGFLAWFFRDPERAPGTDIVSAADGRVLRVEADGARWQIAVFMNVTDVHVNRFPLDATVTAVRDGGAGFRPAYAPDAEHNVRRHYDLATAIGPVEVVQMTGAVARRLVSFVRPGDHGTKGQRFGMIVLGSRVDVFLPRDRVEPLVRGGERVTAGVTPIAQARP